MKVVIAGSRELTDRALLIEAMRNCPWSHEITEVVCGGARGIDMVGDGWAFDVGMPVQYFIVMDTETNYLRNTRRNAAGEVENVEVVADWEVDGLAAGPIRNRAMAAYAERAIVIPLDVKGKRKGSDSMIAEMEALGKEVFVWPVKK